MEFSGRFREAEQMLSVYRRQPSLSLGNRIATLLLPYIKKVARIYMPDRKWYLHYLEITDVINELYVLTVRAIEKSVKHPTPLPYVLSTIKHFCRHIIKSVTKRPYGITECWNKSIESVDAGEINQLALSLVWRDPAIERWEAYKFVCDEIVALPDTCRTAAILKFIYGYAQVEIAQKTKVTPAKVSWQIKRAKRELEKRLKGGIDLELHLRNKEALKVEVRHLKQMGVSLYFLEQKTGLAQGKLQKLLYG